MVSIRRAPNRSTNVPSVPAPAMPATPASDSPIPTCSPVSPITLVANTAFPVRKRPSPAELTMLKRTHRRPGRVSGTRSAISRATAFGVRT